MLVLRNSDKNLLVLKNCGGLAGTVVGTPPEALSVRLRLVVEVDMVLGVDELLVTAVVGEEPNLHCARSAMKIVPEIFFLGAVKSTTCVFEDLGWSGLFPDYSYQAVKE